MFTVHTVSFMSLGTLFSTNNSSVGRLTPPFNYVSPSASTIFVVHVVLYVNLEQSTCFFQEAFQEYYQEEQSNFWLRQFPFCRTKEGKRKVSSVVAASLDEMGRRRLGAHSSIIGLQHNMEGVVGVERKIAVVE